ncbi:MULTISPECIES: efflux RND transporter periplasmic adaptor subunit [Ectothiorhodospira]|uniref:efflux RND transporter periplasmic adaptor subunit n=1 Tax=Ectothiorhodospira TaxID=1051 RepID=UPI001EE8CBCB|nr:MULTISPECIES: HlyD family efflux transporter periplasmic adaptor subunit [Ectothiorhodospira]MCG5493086.1 biotin/lipoyl-binding protein [Ectothiorhodospira variabilis]MCG5502415.1 biotin/lipoyl-binding protein [Ectothiorhodospira variabilis]MCG5505819.1 biotin/lipoyl-binding protein [Ectothiorhodospira variabilis]MCG5524466.1 biotin/lipoyl-binding protein [Ectothiorhodospira haloalkaliphila]
MKLPQPVRRFLPLILLALGILGFILLLITRPEQPPREVAERAWRVDVQEIELQTLSPQLTLYGHVTSPRAASLRAAVEADVTQVPAEEGRRVEAGDTLVELDRRELSLLVDQRQADLDDLQAQLRALERSHARDQEALKREQTLLALARRSVERAEDLQRRNVGSPTAVEDAQRTLEQQALAVANRRLAVEDFEAQQEQIKARARRAESLLEQARLDLERSRLSAPFDARISQVQVAPGDRVRVGDALVALYDLEALEVRARIPATYMPRVRAALEAHDAPQAMGQVDGLEVSLTLARLAGESPAGGAGVEGIFRVHSGAGEIPLGRFMTVRLSLPAQTDVIALPFEALYGLDRIYRLEEDRMRRIGVERIGEWTDASGRERVLVASPELSTGDRIIVTRLPNAMDGLRVSVEGE